MAPRLARSIEQIVWSTAYGVFGLQPSVRDYPALKRDQKRALKDQYTVEVIGASDTVSAKITPSKLLRNVRLSSRVQNIGMT